MSQEMYNPCATCYEKFGHSYIGACDEKCDYANAIKNYNDLLESSIEYFNQTQADQKEISEGLDDLSKGIRHNTELINENLKMLQESK